MTVVTAEGRPCTCLCAGGVFWSCRLQVRFYATQNILRRRRHRSAATAPTEPLLGSPEMPALALHSALLQRAPRSAQRIAASPRRGRPREGRWGWEARPLARSTAPPPPVRCAFEMSEMPLSVSRTIDRRECPAARTFRLILIVKCPRRDPLEPGRPTRRAVSQHALSQLLKVVRDPHQRRRIARRGAATDLGRFRQILRLHETSEKRASHSHTANGCRYLGATSAVRQARDN